MLTRLAALAILAPALAFAQEPQAAPPGATPVVPAVPVEPSPASPPSPADAPPAPAPTRPPTRDTWYIGFGLGTGDGQLKTTSGYYLYTPPPTSYPFDSVNQAGDSIKLSFNFKVGRTLSPTMLLGLDVRAVRSIGEDKQDRQQDLQVTNFDAMLTWFPFERGLFIRGGAGLSILMFTTTAYDSSVYYYGGNIALGGGYAFWLGERLNLTLNLDVSGQKYADGALEGVGNTGTAPMIGVGGQAQHPTSSLMWALSVGFDWY